MGEYGWLCVGDCAKLSLLLRSPSSGEVSIIEPEAIGIVSQVALALAICFPLDLCQSNVIGRSGYALGTLCLELVEMGDEGSKRLDHGYNE